MSYEDLEIDSSVRLTNCEDHLSRSAVIVFAYFHP